MKCVGCWKLRAYGLLCVFRLMRVQVLALIGLVVNQVCYVIMFVTCSWLLAFAPNYLCQVITIIVPHFHLSSRADFTALCLTDTNGENEASLVASSFGLNMVVNSLTDFSSLDHEFYTVLKHEYFHGCSRTNQNLQQNTISVVYWKVTAAVVWPVMLVSQKIHCYNYYSVFIGPRTIHKSTIKVTSDEIDLSWCERLLPKSMSLLDKRHSSPNFFK